MSSKKMIPPDPGKLAEQVVCICAAGDSPQETILRLLQLSVGLVNGVGAVFFRKEGDVLQPKGKVLAEQATSSAEAVFTACKENAHKALSGRSACIAGLPGMPSVSVVSCPVTGVGAVSDSCLTTLVVFGDGPKEPFLIILQLLASVLSGIGNSSLQSRSSAAESTDLFAALLQSESRTDQRGMMNTLQQWLGCTVLAVGTGRSGRVRLKSVSDVVKVDAKTSLSRLYLKVMRDGLQQNRLLAWPPMDSEQNNDESLLVKELLHTSGMQQGVCVVLPGAGGQSTVLVLLWGDVAVQKERIAQLQRAAPILGLVLQSVSKTTAISEEEGAEAASPWKKRAAALLAAGLLAFFAFYPAQFKLHPECQVVPVQINYAAPRFDGLLEKVFVEPGDRVSKGEQLATLDGRELEMELRSVQADSAKALKQRDNHLANGNAAAAQIGLLEYKRLQERAKLLRMRKEQLSLSSPVDGIVLSGDLKKAEGSPVSKGQILFELAPLTTILIELAVADADISHVQKKNRVMVRFDAFPGRSWQGAIDHISPKSTLLQGRNVFVVTFELDNSENLLQPGMRGQASVECGRRSLLWIYFHKPWYALVRLFHSLL